MVKFHKHSGIQGYQLKQKIKDYYEKPRVSSCPPATSGQSHKQGYKSAFSPFQANQNSVSSAKNISSERSGSFARGGYNQYMANQSNQSYLSGHDQPQLSPIKQHIQLGNDIYQGMSNNSR